MHDASNDQHIDYIEFAVTDIDAAKKFYASVFGWSFTDYGPEYTSFSDGRLAGGFRKTDEVSPGGPLVVMFAVDLEAMRQHVLDAGGKLSEDILSFPGGRRFHFIDPAGYELAVWTDRGVAEAS